MVKQTTIHHIRKAHRGKRRIPWMRYVWEGHIAKTPSGLTKSDLMLNKRGKVVSRKRHARGKVLLAQMKQEKRLAVPFTSRTAKAANAKSLRTRRQKKKRKGMAANSMYANVHDMRSHAFEDYYRVNDFH